MKKAIKVFLVRYFFIFLISSPALALKYTLRSFRSDKSNLRFNPLTFVLTIGNSNPFIPEELYNYLPKSSTVSFDCLKMALNVPDGIGLG